MIIKYFKWIIVKVILIIIKLKKKINQFILKWKLKNKRQKFKIIIGMILKIFY
jgi:hypothetical protein